MQLSLLHFVRSENYMDYLGGEIRELMDWVSIYITKGVWVISPSMSGMFIIGLTIVMGGL